MASIDFIHATYGALTLQSSNPSPGDKFQEWVPFVTPIGPQARELGSGILRRYAHRTDYGASFEMAGLSNAPLSVGIAAVLVEHLLSGGTCAVTTDDLDSATYPVCALAPDTTPELILEDRPMLEYRLRLSVINVDAPPVYMGCRY